MSKFKPTDDQKKAIETRGKNIIVSAAAGSGKTRVLVDRLVSIMLEEKIPIKNMIIVTFTNKASVEMKDRIRQKLNDLLKVLGLDDSEAVMKEDESDASLGEDEDKIKKMIDERNEARMNKDYAKADKIRDDLLAMGIKIIDSKDGQRWEKI